jgi:hypothetical protein
MNLTDDLGPDRPAVPISARDQMAFEFAKTFVGSDEMIKVAVLRAAANGVSVNAQIATNAYALADALLAARGTKE